MSDDKNITLFELLPNEILIECFQYLNACYLFRSFDQLNDRFNRLIRHIRLNINFENMNKSMFDEFCTKILLDSPMKNQVYSLYFPFDDDCFQARIFLSLFSHEEFSNLQNYGFILPSTNPLISSHPFRPNVNLTIQPTDPLFSKLRTFSIASLYRFRLWHFARTSSSITNLIIGECYFEYFCHLLKYLPKLKYFRIQRINDRYCEYEKKSFDVEIDCHLKHLIIHDFKGGFNQFEIYVKHTPYLQRLIISNIDNEDLIDAYRLKELITTSLPLLTTFKFIFYSSQLKNENNLINKFNRFRTDFWQEHRWFTEYVIGKDLSFIYTIPYLSNTFKLPQESKRYSNNSRNNVNTFTNVTNLILYQEISTKTSEYYFSNVTSLTLTSCFRQSLTRKYIKYLKKVVNIFHLKHLDITSMGDIISTGILLKLLKKAPQLNSLAISENEVALLFNDEELCNYLNQMIKRLYIYRNRNNTNNNSTYLTEQFCKTFSNIEHLLCEIGYGKVFLFLLSHFPKLSTLHIKWRLVHDSNKYLFQLTNEIRKLNLIADIIVESPRWWYGTSYYDYDSDDIIRDVYLRMWLGKNTSELLTDFMNVMNSLVENLIVKEENIPLIYDELFIDNRLDECR